MIELCGNKRRVLVGFLTRHCHLEEHLSRVGVKHNSGYWFGRVVDKNLEHLILNCTAIRASFFGKAVIDERKMSCLKSSVGIFCKLTAQVRGHNHQVAVQHHIQTKILNFNSIVLVFHRPSCLLFAFFKSWLRLLPSDQLPSNDPLKCG